MTKTTRKKALVLGASGFVGFALVQRLFHHNTEVHCMYHKTPLPLPFNHPFTVKGSLIDYEWKNLNKNLPEVIYHFARIPGIGPKGRKKAALLNAKANERLINWLMSLDTPPLLVFGSGTLVYGNHQNSPVDENTPLHPISYQKEYSRAEIPILEAVKQNSIPVMIMRPPWIYGPGSWFKWFYLDHMEKRKSIPLFGRGHNYMSLIQLEDCAGLIHHYANHGSPGNIYNITGHQPITQNDFANTLSELSELPVQRIPSWKMLLFYDQASRQALHSSLCLDTRHHSLREKYIFQYPDLRMGIGEAMREN